MSSTHDATTVPSADKSANKLARKGARKSQSGRSKKSVAASGVAVGGGAARTKGSSTTTPSKGKARPTAAVKRKAIATAAKTAGAAKPTQSEVKASSRKRSRAPSKKKVVAGASAAQSSNAASSNAGTSTAPNSKRKKSGSSAGSALPRALREWEGQAIAVANRPLGELIQLCTSVFQVASAGAAATAPSTSASSSSSNSSSSSSITQSTQKSPAERPLLDWSALARSNNVNNKNGNKYSWRAESVRQCWRVVNQGRMPVPVKEKSLHLLWNKSGSERGPAAQGPVAQWFISTSGAVDLGKQPVWQSTPQQLAAQVKNEKALAAAAAATAAATAARDEAAAAVALVRESNMRFAHALDHRDTSIEDNLTNNNNNGVDKRSLAAVVGGNKRSRLDDAVRQAPQQQQQQQHPFTGYPMASVAEVHGAAAASSSAGTGTANTAALVAGEPPVDSIALAQATPGFTLWAHVERAQYIEMILTRIRIVTEHRIASDPSCVARAQSEAESQARAVQLGLLSEFFSLPQAQQAEYAKQFNAMTAGVPPPSTTGVGGSTTSASTALTSVGAATTTSSGQPDLEDGGKKKKKKKKKKEGGSSTTASSVTTDVAVVATS